VVNVTICACRPGILLEMKCLMNAWNVLCFKESRALSIYDLHTVHVNVVSAVTYRKARMTRPL
jgi:hypothetical protein